MRRLRACSRFSFYSRSSYYFIDVVGVGVGVVVDIVDIHVNYVL